VLAVLVFSSSFALSVQAQTPSPALFKDLLGAVPQDANALVLIHAEKLRDSPIGTEFREKTFRGTRQVDKHLVPRKNIDRVVIGAELGSDLNPAWEVGIAQLNDDVSLEVLAAQSRGKTETLGKFPALYLDTNAYLVKLKTKMIGAFAPANRQRATRWASRAAASSPSELSPYLQNIASYPETAGTEIMLGLDVAGMADIDRIRENLKRSETMQKVKNVDQGEVAEVLASIQGVALGVKATDKLYAKLRVDFGKSPALMEKFAKALLLEKLGDLGLMIDDFENWSSSVKGNTVYLGGELSPTGLRRILSLVEPPSIPAEKPVPTSNIPSASELDPMALPTQRYFKEVSSLVDDLFKRENAKYAKQAGWYDKYARKISQLSMVNVDPDMMDYGMSVSMAFSSMAYNLRKQSAEASQYSNNRWTYYNVYGDAWNGYWAQWQTDPSDRSKAEKQAKMYGTMSYADTVQSVSNSTAQIRRQMVERYKIDF
jgi:hypothetical protein